MSRQGVGEHSPLSCEVCLEQLKEEAAISANAANQVERWKSRIAGMDSGGEPTLTFHPAPPTGRMQSSRLLGLELEVCSHSPSAYNQGTPKVREVLRRWGAAIGGDCYGDGGFEINTAPAAGREFVRQCKDFERAFREDRVYVTRQCGGHIHVDARDFCWEQMGVLILVSQMVERALHEMTPSYRRGDFIPAGWEYTDYHRLIEIEHRNSYKRVSLVQELLTNPPMEVLMKAFHVVLSPSVSAYGFSSGRVSRSYLGRFRTNISSWIYRGTVEMRHPPGMVLAEEMILWGKMFAWIFDYAHGLELGEAREVLKGRTHVEDLDESRGLLLRIVQRSRELRNFVSQRIWEADCVWNPTVNKDAGSLPERMILGGTYANPSAASV